MACGHLLWQVAQPLLDTSKTPGRGRESPGSEEQCQHSNGNADYAYPFHPGRLGEVKKRHARQQQGDAGAQIRKQRALVGQLGSIQCEVIPDNQLALAKFLIGIMVAHNVTVQCRLFRAASGVTR